MEDIGISEIEDSPRRKLGVFTQLGIYTQLRYNVNVNVSVLFLQN